MGTTKTGREMQKKPDTENIMSFTEDVILYRTTTAATTLHTMHAVKLCVPIEGSVTIGGCGYPEASGRVPILVKANVPHTLSCEGIVATLFLAPELPEVRRILWPSNRPFVWLTGKQGQVLKELALSQPLQIPSGDLVDLTQEWMSCLSLETAKVTFDGRVEAVQERLKYGIRFGELDLSLDALASEVKLSSYRLSHLFREQTGCTLQRYILWLKLFHSFTFFANGYSITHAAHSAGFSDHAHLSRTTRKIIGRTPSEVLRSSKIVQAKE